MSAAMAIPAVPPRQRLLSNDSSHSITSTGSNGSGGSDSSDLSAGTRRRLARVRRLSGRIQAVATKSSASARSVEAGNGHTRRSSAPPASLSQLRVRVLKRVGSDAHVPYSPIKSAREASALRHANSMPAGILRAAASASGRISPSPIRGTAASTGTGSGVGAGGVASSAQAMATTSAPVSVAPPQPGHRAAASAAAAAGAAPPPPPVHRPAHAATAAVVVSPLQPSSKRDPLSSSDHAVQLERRVVRVQLNSRAPSGAHTSGQHADDGSQHDAGALEGGEGHGNVAAEGAVVHKRSRWRSPKLAGFVKKIAAISHLGRRKKKKNKPGSGEAHVSFAGGDHPSDQRSAPAIQRAHTPLGRTSQRALALNAAAANAAASGSVKHRPPTPFPAAGSDDSPNRIMAGVTPRHSGSFDFPDEGDSTGSGSGSGHDDVPSDDELHRSRFAHHRNSVSLTSGALPALIARQEAEAAAEEEAAAAEAAAAAAAAARGQHTRRVRIEDHPVASPLNPGAGGGDIADAAGQGEADCDVVLHEPRHREVGRVRGILKVRSHTRRVQRACSGHRRLVFADTQGGELENTYYADNLHYSRRQRRRFWFF